MDQPDLWAARAQMALSLAWHIVIACFGVGLPLLVLIAEFRAQRGGGAVYDELAHRWAKVLAVLFAVGAVSGTILSFEMGILWPRLIATFGSVLGLPFAIEGIAFFIEAIFIGIYLYGWDRLSPRVHLLTGIPIVIGGIASAWFVVTANAWLNQPVGFTLTNGVVTGVDPWGAILNPATPIETTHMILAALMVTGFGIAAGHAWGLRHDPASALHRVGFLVAFTLAAIVTPFQIVVGDAAAQFLAANQPIKLAAIEGLYDSQRGAPLTIGGIPIDGHMYLGLQIPDGLSLLAFRDPNALVVGLNTVAADLQPPVLPVHIAFQIMVGIGFALLGLSAWLAWSWYRRRGMPGSRAFLVGSILAGPGAVIAMEAGWVVTELGRQPWIVYGIMQVDEAVTAARGLPIALFTLVAVYIALTIGTVVVLRRTLAPDTGESAGRTDGRTSPVTAADAILAVLWAGLTVYALFGGADFGAGFWDLLGGGRDTDRVRALIEETIGPVWEANHVWLIFALVVVWTAFPPVFAAVASTLYIPLTIVAIGVILRGSGFAFRKSVRDPTLKRWFGVLFGLSSIITPFFLGAIAGGIASGRVPPGNAAGDPIGSWVNPTSILGGLLAVGLCSYLAAVYLTADARRIGDAVLAEAFRARALVTGLGVGTLALLGIVVLASDATTLYAGLTSRALPVIALSVVAGAASLALLWRRWFGAARLTSALAVGAILWGWAVAQYPYLLVGSLTVGQAQALDATLVALLIALLIGAVLVIPSTIALFVLAQRPRAR